MGDSNNNESFFRHLFSGALRGLTDLKGIVSERVPFMQIGQIKNQAKPGDMLEFHRGSGTHYALYLGDGKVLNIDAENHEASEAQIKEYKLHEVCSGYKIRVSSHEDVAQAIFNLGPKSEEQILEDALSYVNKVVPYEFDFRNCEYYCTLWRYGKGFSTQAAEESTLAGSNAERAAFDNTTEHVFKAVGYAKYRELAGDPEGLC